MTANRPPQSQLIGSATLKGLVFDQLKKGLRESDTQRLSVAIIGFGLLILVRLVRGSATKRTYRRRIRGGDVLEMRMIERPRRNRGRS